MSELKNINHVEKEIKMKKTIIIVLGLIFVAGIYADQYHGKGLKKECKSVKRMEERGLRGENRAEIIAFRLTKKLELSTEQADQFFPRFREHQESMKGLRDELRDINKDIFTKIKDDDEISDAELNKALKNIKILKNKQQAERDKFIDGLDGILDNNQIAKLALAPKHLGKGGKMHKELGPQKRK